MRKYSLADGSKRGSVDLRDYEDVIVAAVAEFAPGIAVTVRKDCYIVNGQLSQSQAVKIGRRICESSLSKHCIKLSKLFNWTLSELSVSELLSNNDTIDTKAASKKKSKPLVTKKEALTGFVALP